MVSDEIDDYKSEVRSVAPDKTSVYDTKAEDLSLSQALMEVIDNILDNARRVPRTDNPEIEIRYDFDRNEDGTKVETLTVWDNTGGVKSKKDMDKFLQFGETSEDEMFRNKLGAYGVGFKGATRRLARGVRVTSRYGSSDADTYVLEAPDEWFEEEEKFEYELRTSPDSIVDRGETKITFTDLRFDWDEEKDDFVEDLTQVYELYLRDDEFADEYITADITLVNCPSGEREQLSVDDSSYDYYPINWSYIPCAFYPRRYENIEISDAPNHSGPIYANITVGFRRGDSSEKNGTHLYIQGRNISRFDSGASGGFGSKYKNTLSSLSSDHRKLMVVVELVALNDPSELPWTTVKTGMESDKLMATVFNKMKKVVEDYRDEGSKDKFEISFFKPYTSSHEESTRPDVYSCKGRQVISHDKRIEDDEVELLHNVRVRAEAHRTLEIFCPESVPKRLQPAYKSYLQNHCGDTDTLCDIAPEEDITIEDPRETGSESFVDEIKEDICKTKRRNKGRLDHEWVVLDPERIPTWGREYYKSQISDKTGNTIDRLKTVSTLADIPTVDDIDDNNDDDDDDDDDDEDVTNVPHVDLSLQESDFEEFRNAVSDGLDLSDDVFMDEYVDAVCRHADCDLHHTSLPPGALESENARRVWKQMEKEGGFASVPGSRGRGLQPCGSTTQAQCMVGAVRALLDEGKLSKDMLPIEKGPDWYILNQEPVHKDHDMEDPKEVVPGIWIETKSNRYEKHTCLVKVAQAVAEETN